MTTDNQRNEAIGARIPEPDISPLEFTQAVARIYIAKCQIYEKALLAISGNAVSKAYYQVARDALKEAEQIGVPL